MSKPRKRWDEHSARWKREASRDGMTKARWDTWLKLTKPVRQLTNAREYATGKPVQQLIHRGLISRVIGAMLGHFPTAREGTVKLGAEEMTGKQLRWTLQATANQIRRRARRKYPPGERNPWWYN